MNAKPESLRTSTDPLSLRRDTDATSTRDMKKGGPDWILRKYLSEISRTKLLTPTEEKELARRVRAGDMMAREHMIKANLRLVVKIAANYRELRLSFLDLINEGNIGLMEAVDRYDPDHEKNARFSTYAGWWIRQTIKSALSRQSRTIRLPEHVTSLKRQIDETSSKLYLQLRREPDDDEIAEEAGLQVADIRKNRRAQHGMIYLDMSVDRDYDATMEQYIADENALTPLDRLEGDTALLQLEALVSRLPVREQEVLRRHFGLSGRNRETFDSIGDSFGLTRSRAGQIKETALKKLRGMYASLETKASLQRVLGKPLSEMVPDGSEGDAVLP